MTDWKWYCASFWTSITWNLIPRNQLVGVVRMSVYFIQIECSAELYLFISLEVMCENYGSMVFATAIFHCISQGAILQAKMCDKSTNLYFELIWNANKFSHILVYLNFDSKWAALCIKDALTMHPHISFGNIYVILNVLWVNSTE